MGAWVVVTLLLLPVLLATLLFALIFPCCPKRLRQKSFSWAFRMLLPFRYTVKVKGFSNVPNDQGVLFLPNHPALADPLIMISYLHSRFRVRPVTAEDVYLSFGSIFDKADPIVIPSFGEGTNSYTKHVMKGVLEGIVSELENGKAVLLYPSGRLMRSGQHFLEIGASSTYDIMGMRRADKPWRVCLVHIDGLWGSRFSTAYTGGRPSFFKELKRGICELFCNLLLFMPKRRVDIEFELVEMPKFDDKLSLNKWLMNKYNGGGEETLAKPGDKDYRAGKGRVPTRCCSTKVRELPDSADKATEHDDGAEELDPKVVSRVLPALAKHLGKPASELQLSQNLAYDLGMDSIQIGELLGWLDEEFNVQDVQATELKTVASVVHIISGRSRADAPVETRPPPEAWKESNRPPLAKSIEGNSVPEAFIRNAKRMGKSVMAGDELSGVIKYDRALIGAIMFADFLKAHPERCEGGRVGIMMPAAAGVGILIAAVGLAGCSPVMVNWTVGRASLEYVLKSTKVKTVITSKRFLKKLGADVDLSCLLEQPGLLLFTDDLKENKFGGFGKASKLKALLASRKSADSLIRRYKVHEIDRSKECVVLFTSGSESFPKGVPLSHGNVLSNIEGMLAVAEARDSDCMFGALPPFHSFGFTVTTVGPMVSGLKAAYYPNPTEYRRIAREMGRWSPSIYLGTPTFVNGALLAAKAEKDKQKGATVAAAPNKNNPAAVVPIVQESRWLTGSLRLCVVGAEKSPDSLYQLCQDEHQPPVELLEGYGITETGPVLSANRPGKPRNGVGWTIPNTSVALLAVDPYLLKDIQVIATCSSDHKVDGAVGEQGVIVVQGPSVFGKPDGEPPSAYLGIPISEKNPFIKAKDSWWYDTGDLGYLDEHGGIHLTGRLKRFVKVAGEMISLGALEAALKAMQRENGEKPWADREEGPVIAVESHEPDDEKPILGVIAAVDVDLDAVNLQLREAGMPKIAKVTVIVDARKAFDARWAEQGTLPLLGTGKSDYAQMKRALKAQIVGKP